MMSIGGWVSFRVNDVVQMMRWIPAGEFRWVDQEEGQLSESEGPRRHIIRSGIMDV